MVVVVLLCRVRAVRKGDKAMPEQTGGSETTGKPKRREFWPEGTKEAKTARLNGHARCARSTGAPPWLQSSGRL